MKKDYFLIFITFGLVMTRLLPHPPNFTPIIAFAIIGPLLFNSRFLGISVIIFSMFISDLFIGFHSYQFIIYLTLISISFFTPLIVSYGYLTLTAIGASFWFFIITNFSVWIFWDYYPKTIEGLVACYTLAIPFFNNTLISTLLFTLLLTYLLKYLYLVNNLLNSMFSKISIKKSF